MTSETRESPKKGGGLGCFFGLGLGLALPAAGLLFGWLQLGLSLWSAALGAGLGLVALGGAARAMGLASATRLLGAGAALVVAPWLVRSIAVRGSERARLTLLPDDGGPRLLSKVYPERDGTLLAAHWLGKTSQLDDDEAAQLPEILQQAFERMDPSADDVPTPAIGTYLGLQSAEHFDTLVLRPPPGRVASDAALIFLHGYAGNFYVYCWEVAQAAAAANLMTLCPSLDASGAWWSPEGEKTLRATLDYAHRTGMNRIYLAGLSNGAAGASVLALSHARELSGLVLISGTRAEQPPPLPTLVVQGAADRMMSAGTARAYARRSAQAQYRQIPGGHFILLSRHTQVRPLIGDFLLGLEQRAPGSPAFVPQPKR
jgi:hypothetical protein